MSAASDRTQLKVGWLKRLLNSSVGRKMVMGATGLLLCGFLVVHLAGNLLLFAGAGPYNHYAHMLHEQEWLPLAEAGLFFLFIAHIYLAVVTTMENRQKRPVDYAVRRSKQADPMLVVPRAHNWMFISGAIVLGFILLHLVDMKFQWRSSLVYSESSPYENALVVLNDPTSRIIYSVGVIVLGFHLSHGFASAFQSLGLVHKKYTPIIQRLSPLVAIVLAAGFLSLPLLIPNISRPKENVGVEARPPQAERGK